MQLSEAIKTRRSVRRYLDKKPDWRKIIKAIDMARFAPAAGNQFAMKFILVRDKNKIEKLAEASQQEFVKEASYVVVAVSDVSKLTRSYGDQGEVFARQQAGAAIQNFLLALNEQKLATCWVGYFVEEQVKKILEIPFEESLVVEAFFPVGKETKAIGQGKEKPNPDLENLLYFDKWKNQYMEPHTIVQLENS